VWGGASPGKARKSSASSSSSSSSSSEVRFKGCEVDMSRFAAFVSKGVCIGDRMSQVAREHKATPIRRRRQGMEEG
jgi:hypothetical protein